MDYFFIEGNTLLPISKYLPEIKKSLANANNLVLQAEPGAGKSTALPMSLLHADWLHGKKIVMLEPRRVAVKTIAHYLARQLGEKVGQRIGYQIRNDRKVSRDTILEIVTEGILSRRIQNDAEISDIALIIFDEFHERAIQADLSLMLALEIQNTIREDLKLMVMSATIDTALIANYLGNADVIECPGRAFPVSVNYNHSTKEPLSRQVTGLLRQILTSEGEGDVLVFLPGQAEIRKSLFAAREAFKARSDLAFLALYGSLSLQQQEQALVADANGRRKVIFSTNIAETSLTIEGISCVIDSGQEKVLVYDPSSYMTRLETSWISKASAEQRKGRAGRIEAGHCFRLWDKNRHQKLKEYQDEEILSADLTGLVLELMLWGENSYEGINWLTAPPQPHFDAAIKTLFSLGLINSAKQLTAFGRKAVGTGISPRLSTMLLKADNDIQKGIACDLAALLSERDVFSKSTGVDIIDRMLAVQEYRKNRQSAVKAYPLKGSSIEQQLTSARSLRKNFRLESSVSTVSLDQLQESVGPLLLYAYPDRLAKRRSKNSGRYQLANGKGVFLFEDDPLAGNEWLVVADCDAQKREGRIFSAAAISLESIMNNAQDRLTVQDEYHFNKDKRKITGKTVTRYGSIEVKASILTTIPPQQFQNCLLQILREDAFTILNWTDQCEKWLSRAHWLGTQLKSFPQLSRESLKRDIDDWLLPYLSNVKSISDLKKVKVFDLMVSILSWEDQQILQKEAPTHYITPGNKSVSITYDDHQGPTVSVILQEVFGEVESPKLAGGAIPLRFELLSPARRPIQTTSDLGNFWHSSYFDVAREMKGRYPKHRWPERPLLEKAGKSYKRKSM